MHLESTQNNALAKLSLLKQEDGNSFKSVVRTTTNVDGTSTSTILGAVIDEEKIQKKNDLKAQSILMMTLPSENLLTFNQYKDAKTLFEAIEARFGGNEATKKTQKTLLKQMYENFNASSSESLDSIFTRLQKIVVHEDLEQIHEDDLEEMDLKWQLTLLSMKARKFYQRTGKKIIINGSDTAGYDKKKVECFNCQKMGHFARKCRNPRSQQYRSRNQDNSRKTVNVEQSSSKAMLAIDGIQRIELNKSEFDLANYKSGLAYVEEQLVFYKKNESMLCDQIAVVKRDASFNESEINALKIQIERLKKEKESNQIKIDNFENASKSLDKLIGCQISDNNRKGVGYNSVAPLPTGLFTPPTIDLSNSSLEEFKQPEFKGYGVKVNKSVSENSFNEIKKTSGAPIIEDWISDCNEDETLEKVSESANVQKPKQADQPRKIS
ncbi:ribonuclease H-like domain-containing protein [Tanacetum coccineum]